MLCLWFLLIVTLTGCVGWLPDSDGPMGAEGVELVEAAVREDRIEYLPPDRAVQPGQAHLA